MQWDLLKKKNNKKWKNKTENEPKKKKRWESRNRNWLSNRFPRGKESMG